MKGKTHPAGISESLGHHTAGSFPRLAEVIRNYEAWLDRCRYYRLHPPSQDWGGVWIMEEK